MKREKIQPANDVIVKGKNKNGWWVGFLYTYKRNGKTAILDLGNGQKVQVPTSTITLS